MNPYVHKTLPQPNGKTREGIKCVTLIEDFSIQLLSDTKLILTNKSLTEIYQADIPAGISLFKMYWSKNSQYRNAQLGLSSFTNSVSITLWKVYFSDLRDLRDSGKLANIVFNSQILYQYLLKKRKEKQPHFHLISVHRFDRFSLKHWVMKPCQPIVSRVTWTSHDQKARLNSQSSGSGGRGLSWRETSVHSYTPWTHIHTAHTYRSHTHNINI